MKFFIDVAYKSLFKKGEELCGDKVEIIRTEESVILVLADGLGSGVKANILSTLTSKIIGTMLKEGAHVEEAVETIAKTLPICNVRGLAYSTFTILQIFYTGEAYVVEFDNPTLIFVRDGKLIDLPMEERMISGKNVRECRFSYTLGDVFTIVSDGVVFAGVGAVLDFGWGWDNAAEYIKNLAGTEPTATRIALGLSQVCDNLYMSKPGDDTTVLVAKILPQKTVNLLSGTPKDKSKDADMVHDFMRSPGKKAVCGGSTSNMLSREIGRPINTSLDYLDPDVPPIAYIDGIDLVTEGVLTLSRTVEILRRCADESTRDAALHDLEKQDGASQLAKLLVDDCTLLKLFVGKSINPAHQNPSLPIDLSIKLRILDELADLMRQLGKNVEKYEYQ